LIETMTMLDNAIATARQRNETRDRGPSRAAMLAAQTRRR
jgi:hypothetical protein